MVLDLASWCYHGSTLISAESVVVLSPHGVQLETHYGFPSIPLMVSRRFIPTISLQDFVVIEGLHHWNVRYFLAVIKRSESGGFSLEPVYEVRCF
jgi:phosphatidylinositol glycan class H protein